MTVLLILTGALLTVASCMAAGRFVFRSVGLPPQPSIQFTTGAALLSSLIFAFCMLHVVSTLTLVALAAGVLLMGRGRLNLPRVNLWWIPFAVFGVFYLINAMAPEISADGAFYHLAFPARYLRAGGFLKTPTNFYGNFSQGLEMLFLLAFSVGKHSAAALTHLSFLFVLTATTIAYATFIGQPKAGWLAALILFTSPVIAIDATLAYNDVAAAAVVFTLFFTLARWDHERTTNWLLVAGLLAGFAYAIKYTAGIAILYALGFVLWRSRSVKALLPVAACAAFMVAPWMLKNWLWFDNPVSPFFNRAFPNAYTSVAFEDEYRDDLRHFNGANFDWKLPVELAVTGDKVQGNLGPAFLLAPLALLRLRSTEVRRLVCAGGVMLLPWFANHGTRFLIPCAPFFALALALTISQWKWAISLFAIIQLVLCWPAFVGLYCDQYNWRLAEFPVAAAFRQIPEADYISSRIDGYAVVKMVDANTSAGAVIYTSQELPEAYSQRDYVVRGLGALNQFLDEMLATPFDTDFQPIVRLTFHPEAHATQALRIVQKGNCGGYWSMAEIRWTPGRDATITAKPEPWHAAWAHDGNPATRWKVWQAPAKGMYWEARFAQPGALATVEIDGAPDQSNTCVELQIQTAAGHWLTHAEAPQIRALPLDPASRQHVTSEFRKQGISHILLTPTDHLAADFEAHPDAWNVSKVAESAAARLYRLDSPTKTFTNGNVSIDLSAKTRNNQKE